MNDARAGDSPWTTPRVVRGFVDSPPNARLLAFAAEERARRGVSGRALDIGCGAARNASPLAASGWTVVGVDTSAPMLSAAAARARDAALHSLHLAFATMTHLPFAEGAFDLVIAHGVWNLASSDAMWRAAVEEAARVLRRAGALFLFTFSRHTLPADAAPAAGETYVYDQFSGTRQVFLTSDQIHEEMSAAGFVADAAVPLVEHNRPQHAALSVGGPVIYEGAFRRWPASAPW